MHRKYRVSAIQSVRRSRPRLRKPTSKELDLFLLAGCSCLLTVLTHPIADAVQLAHTLSSNKTTISTQASIPSNTVSGFHLTLPPARDDLCEEEEA